MISLLLATLALAGSPKKAPPPVAPPPPPPVVEVAPPVDPLGPPPVPTATVDFHPPIPAAVNLSNGASVWVIADNSLPLVSITIEVPGGSVLDPLGQEGLASLSNRLMSKGAGKLDAVAFAEQVERLGIQLNVGTSLNTSYITVSAKKDQIDEAIGLVAEMILHPSYKGADYRRERGLAAMEVASELDDPVSVARRLANALYFGPGSAWGRPSDGTEAGLKAAKLKKLKDFHARVWTPGGARITVAGAMAADEAQQLLESKLGAAWAAAPAAVVPTPNVPSHNNEPIYIVDRPGSAQTTFYLLFPGVSFGAATEAPLRTGTIALGGTFTSRLNQLLREKRGYTYGVKARTVEYPQTGYLLISSRIRTDATAPAMTDLMGELARIQEGVTPDEVVKARLAWQQDQVEAMGSRDGIAATFSEYHFAGLKPGALSDALTAMKGVSAEAVLPAMKAYNPAGAVIVLVGDRKAIEESLKQAGFGKIQGMDAI